MISENKKLFFQTTFIIFEDSKIRDALRSNKYSSVVGITRTDLGFPEFLRWTKTTSIIDLSKPKEDIFSTFSDTTRNEVRRTEKNSDLSIVSDDKNRDSVYTLYKKFEYSQGRVPFQESNMEACIIFSAYLNNEIISSIYVDKGDKDLRIRYIFSKRLDTSDKEMYKTIGFASKRLIWQICLWGKERRFSFLDMATVNLTDKGKEGISSFKMSFGGELVEEYTYMKKTKLFSYFEALAVLKNKLMKFFH